MGCIRFLIILLVLAWLLVQGALLVVAGAVQRVSGAGGGPHLHAGALIILLVGIGLFVLFLKLFVK